MNEYDRALSPAEIGGTNDESINFSDIAELDEASWQGAKLDEPDPTGPALADQLAERSPAA